MMKKCFYSLLAATGMLLATSCSQDDLANEISSESKVVTFKVNVPKQFESRAIGDGGGANKLIYAMYEESNLQYEQTDMQLQPLHSPAQTQEL